MSDIYYEMRKAAGLCVRCGKAPPREGRTSCEACGRKTAAREHERWKSMTPEKHKARKAQMAQRRDALREAGICTVCGKRPARLDHDTCEECAEMYRNYAAGYRKCAQGARGERKAEKDGTVSGQAAQGGGEGRGGRVEGREGGRAQDGLERRDGAQGGRGDRSDVGVRGRHEAWTVDAADREGQERPGARDAEAVRPDHVDRHRGDQRADGPADRQGADLARRTLKEAAWDTRLKYASGNYKGGHFDHYIEYKGEMWLKSELWAALGNEYGYSLSYVSHTFTEVGRDVEKLEAELKKKAAKRERRSIASLEGAERKADANKSFNAMTDEEKAMWIFRKLLFPVKEMETVRKMGWKARRAKDGRWYLRGEELTWVVDIADRSVECFMKGKCIRRWEAVKV